MSGWNFADVYEAVARHAPERPCQVCGDRVVTWGEFDRRADALAADLLAAGLGHQAKVAAYLQNGVEYLEVYVAAFKAGMAPVNTNYRYGPDEITYLWDNADAEAVVFHAAFSELVEKVRPTLPRVRRWYVVADETGAGPTWATPYEATVSADVQGPVRGPWGRSGDDLLLLYTGGTTGMPKGVMWRQDDLWNVLGSGGNALFGFDPVASLAELEQRTASGRVGPAVLSACPLMHGTGQFSSMIAMGMAGTVVTLPSRRFDVAELWRTVQERRCNSVVIVGDAFAKPMLAELDAHPGAYDLSSLMAITSSGVMWSQETKSGLLGHAPHIALFDSHGSSEAVGLSGSVSTKDGTSATAAFVLGPNSGVFTDDGRRVEPGSGESGMVAVSGFIPLGYYKDEAKTAATFRTFEGRRWSVPGDWAQVNAEGSLTLLGRGSVCINTGGEKVFPEEVEEALKRHPKVLDAVCVGIPDDRFGETICAVVEVEQDAASEAPTLDELATHVKSGLAAYKAPRHLVVVDTIGRAPNGKVDYKGLKQLSLERLGVS